MRLVYNLLILTSILIVTGCSSKTKTEELVLLMGKIDDLEQNMNDLDQKTRADKPIDVHQIFTDNGWSCGLYGCYKSRDESQPYTALIIKPTFISIRVSQHEINNHITSQLFLSSPIFSYITIEGGVEVDLNYNIYSGKVTCTPSSKIDCDKYIEENMKVLDEVKSSYSKIIRDLDISVEDLIYYNKYHYLYMENDNISIWLNWNVNDI
ncbi:hypothetical protein RI065_09700 [Mycoplasmatota bacterium zrk1]